jgi:general secretion pathway protein N
VAGAALGIVSAVIAFAPARWLADAVAQASGGQLLLLQPRGTVWTGSAQLVLTGGNASNDRTALPGRVDWRLRPTWTGVRAPGRWGVVSPEDGCPRSSFTCTFTRSTRS